MINKYAAIKTWKGKKLKKLEKMESEITELKSSIQKINEDLKLVRNKIENNSKKIDNQLI